MNLKQVPARWIYCPVLHPNAVIEMLKEERKKCFLSFHAYNVWTTIFKFYQNNTKYSIVMPKHKKTMVSEDCLFWLATQIIELVYMYIL